MNTHDPINAYLSNEMTPDQERQFLISVAASDSLRRALKSEVMIERIITREEREMAVPHTLRSAILAEAGLAAAAPSHNTPAEQPVHTPRWRQWLKGSTIGAAGLLAGLLLAPAVMDQQKPTPIVRVQQAPTQGITVAVSAIPVPIPTEAPAAIDQIDRQEQVRTVIIDRFLPGRPVATAASRSAAAAEQRKEQISVSDYRTDNPLNPSNDRQRKENGVQAGTSSQSSPLAPGGR